MANIFSTHTGQCVCGYPLDRLGRCTNTMHGTTYTGTNYTSSTNNHVLIEKQNNLLIRFLNVYDYLSLEEQSYIRSLLFSYSEDHYIMIDAFLNRKTSEILK